MTKNFVVLVSDLTDDGKVAYDVLPYIAHICASRAEAKRWIAQDVARFDGWGFTARGRGMHWYESYQMCAGKRVYQYLYRVLEAS